MTTLLWIFATPLIAWMAGAGLAGLAGHRSAVETFDRLGYSPARRMAAAGAELLSATGVLLGAAFPDMAIGVSGTVAANFITGLTWFVIGNSDTSHRDKIGGWAVTILATGYLVTLIDPVTRRTEQRRVPNSLPVSPSSTTERAAFADILTGLAPALYDSYTISYDNSGTDSLQRRRAFPHRQSS